MASATLQVSSTFPAGTNVSAYALGDVPYQLPGPPQAPAVAGGVVGTNGKVTLTGLPVHGVYILGGLVGSDYKRVTFTIYPDTAAAGIDTGSSEPGPTGPPGPPGPQGPPGSGGGDTSGLVAGTGVSDIIQSDTEPAGLTATQLWSAPVTRAITTPSTPATTVAVQNTTATQQFFSAQYTIASSGSAVSFTVEVSPDGTAWTQWANPSLNTASGTVGGTVVFPLPAGWSYRLTYAAGVTIVGVRRLA